MTDYQHRFKLQNFTCKPSRSKGIPLGVFWGPINSVLPNIVQIMMLRRGDVDSEGADPMMDSLHHQYVDAPSFASMQQQPLNFTRTKYYCDWGRMDG